MITLKKIIAALIIFIASFVVSCDNDPLLTDIGTSRLIVVIKGTYESNSPMPWKMPALCATRNADGSCSQYTPEYLSLMQDDSVIRCNSTGDQLPASFMIDLSEMRLWDLKNTYKFSNYRQILASGLNDLDPLFNGGGYPLINDDVPSRTYPFVLLYIRKMLIDGALNYFETNSGWSPSIMWDVFNEKELPSFNFNPLQTHSFYDTLRFDSTSINRVYPLMIPINDIITSGGGLIFKKQFKTTVLEIRIVLKNYLKKYETSSFLTTGLGVTHFYAPSDFVNDVQKGDSYIGGNIIAVARSYIPELVGAIRGRVPTDAARTGAHIIAIPHDATGRNINFFTLETNPWGARGITPPSGAQISVRNYNPCGLPIAPSYYTGTNIYGALSWCLKNERFKHEWNLKVPVTGPNGCYSYNTYVNDWNTYFGETGNFNVPQLCVYTPVSPTVRNSFVIENVMPGAYDIYISNVDPTYGQLYKSGEFTLVGPPVMVGPGVQAYVDITSF